MQDATHEKFLFEEEDLIQALEGNSIYFLFWFIFYSFIALTSKDLELKNLFLQLQKSLYRSFRKLEFILQSIGSFFLIKIES